MNLLELTLPTIHENLALDEALLLEAEAGGRGDTLRFWELTAPAVVLGAACKLDEDVVLANCRADSVPIARRASGGGTVLLDEGCLAFTLVLAASAAPELADIRSSYCYIMGRLCKALADVAPDIHCSGTSDLVLDNRKVSGNAQQRKRRCILHHGTLLYGFDTARVERYLRAPARQPDYRRQRSHAEFIGSLNATSDDLKARLSADWQARDREVGWPADEVQRLLAEKYLRDDWLRRR